MLHTPTSTNADPSTQVAIQQPFASESPTAATQIALANDDEKKKRKKSRRMNYSQYNYQVLKLIHPVGIGISKQSMAIMNIYMNDVFERIATEASKLAALSRKSTISAREIQASIRRIFNGELITHSISEGTKAVAKFKRSSQAIARGSVSGSEL